MSKVVLKVQGLGKRYRLYAFPHHRLLTLLGWQDHSRAHWALKGVSFELHQGQCLGVIGDNGAGKSTLLKLLAGTLQPTDGQLTREGRVTAILELGSGFHPDFSGRDNLLFGGSVIGLSRDEMLMLLDSIIEFSELGDAIDRPVKTYSSGMIVRLAFSLVTAVQPDLLIIDEALSVGDQHFQRKCVERIEQYRNSGCTILFCSHSLYHVNQLCSHVLWLDQGQIKGLGTTQKVLSEYETHVRLQDASIPQLPPIPASAAPVSDNTPALTPSPSAKLVLAQIEGHPDEDTGCPSGPDLIVTVRAITEAQETPSIGIMLEQYHGVGITSLATHAEGVKPSVVRNEGGFTTWQVTLTFPALPLHSGNYSLSFYLFDEKGLVVYEEWKDHLQFQWLSHSLTPGLVRLPHRWG